MFSYSTSVHKDIKCTLYELAFEKLAHLTSSNPFPEHTILEMDDMYMTKLISKLLEMRGTARSKLSAAKKKV